MLFKGEEHYYISNVNYIELNKEEYFEIINDNKFLMKKLRNVEALNNQKLGIMNIVNLATDNLDMVDWLSNPQIDTLRDFMKTNPIVGEEGYYLLNLKIDSEKTKEVLKKISFSSKVEDPNIVVNIYSNILNIQTNDYFDYLDRVVLVTNNLHINENNLVDYMNDKITMSVEFKTITKSVPSSLSKENGYELNSPSTIFVLSIEKKDKDGNVIY